MDKPSEYPGDIEGQPAILFAELDLVENTELDSVILKYAEL